MLTMCQFERVFVLNLPQRGDRLDGFTLAASMTGFSAEVMPGINGSLVPDNSLPSVDGIVRAHGILQREDAHST